MLSTFLAIFYLITIGITSAFPLELIPAHFIGFEHPNVMQQRIGQMNGNGVHHHHIGLIPTSLDRMNLEATNIEINNFGQRTAPTRYSNPINHVRPTIMYNQHHRQAEHQFLRIHPHPQQQQQLYQNQRHQLQHQPQHHHQQNLVNNNINGLHPAYESSQFQPYYNSQSNQHSSQGSSMLHDHQHPTRQLVGLKHYNRQAGIAESREDHQQEENQNAHHEELKKEEENQTNQNEEYKQPEVEKKHDEEPQHHEEHHEGQHHVPDAIEVHHKKGGKSFQYFHQHHS